VSLLKSLSYEVFDVKNLDQPISVRSLRPGILDTVNVVAFPLGHSY
jgi:hypothetical protein